MKPRYTKFFILSFLLMLVSFVYAQSLEELMQKGDNYYKEFIGHKPNTIRKISNRYEFAEFVDFMNQLSANSKIKIVETDNGKETGMSFERYITDITPFERYYIISWKHEEEK